MRTVAIIPARLQSSRLPKKPLVDINGKSMIRRVYENVLNSSVDDVIVACDHVDIINEITAIKGKAVITSSNHTNGSSRVAEIANKIDADVIINIQGDEPLVNNVVISEVLSAFDDKECNVATLKKKITDVNEIKNPNCVKVVTNRNNEALLFSRSPIPYNRDNNNIVYYKHIGIYAYKKEFLMKYIRMHKSYLETAESLEQLRILENGYKIKVIETKKELIGVDTYEDLEKVRRVLSDM